MEILIFLGISLAFLAVGFFAGGYQERLHFRRLEQREANSIGFAITQIETFPGGVDPSLPPQAFIAESVIASDYLKTFIAGLRKFFGGEMGSYISLLERARREALQRLVEQAQTQGYDSLCNLRYESADIGGATNPKKTIVAVAIIATATAYKRPTGQQPL